MISAGLTPSLICAPVLAANRPLRFGIFALEPGDEFGDWLHGFDRSDTLPASPDVSPGLGFR